MAGSILGSLLLEIVTKANTSGLSKTDSSIKKWVELYNKHQKMLVY